MNWHRASTDRPTPSVSCLPGAQGAAIIAGRVNRDANVWASVSERLNSVLRIMNMLLAGTVVVLAVR